MSNGMDKRIVVVGGGFGGLAAACTLAARGFRVTVLEKNDWLGGKAAVLERDGFRFDMGPTVLTLPSVLARIFAEAGVRTSDYLQLIPLDPQWRCLFDDGSQCDLVADVDQMAQRLQEYTGRTDVAQGYRDFLRCSARMHEVSNRYFFWRNVGSVWDTFQTRRMFDLNVLRDVLNLKMGQTVGRVVRSHIPDRRIAQMVDHFTQYVGSAPDASPAVLCSIAHMQTEEGVWYPLGGIGAVSRALEQLARDLGVELRCRTAVRAIAHDRGKIRGVELDSGEMIVSSAVVCNSDSVRTHRELLAGPEARRFERHRSCEPSCSGVVLYLGLNRRYDHLLHHNFVFSRDPHEEFDAIYRRGVPAPDPTCYVCAPARTDPNVAPPGGEALYVLVHTPYLRAGQNWLESIADYRRTIFDKLARTAGLDDLERHIVIEERLTPLDIQDRYGVLQGAIYGLASHGRFWGAFKPANRSPDFTGLYFAGGSAHPGPGVPMVLMSGWIAADTLDSDLRAHHHERHYRDDTLERESRQRSAI